MTSMSLFETRCTPAESDTAPADTLTLATAQLDGLLASIRKLVASGEASRFDDEGLQQLFTAAVTLYAHKFDAGQRMLPLHKPNDISATAIMIAATGLLRSADLELFELGMWQSWSGTR